jgi:hypothetical protein
MQGPVAINKAKNDADEAVSVVSLISSFEGYINGRNSANLELLIDKTSSINLNFSSITYLSPLEGHCFSRSSAYQWVRIVPLF